MTKARYVVPGQVVSLVRRTNGRRAGLQPTTLISEVFGYCLGHVQAKTGMRILAYAMMPTHYHLTVEDVEGRLPDFMREFDSLLARILNAEYGRQAEHFWSPERGAWTVELTAQAQADSVVYALMNPTRAGLVRHPKRWRGAMSLPEMLGTSRVIKRPNARFFGKRSILPEEVTLRLDVPSAVEEAGDAEAWRKRINKQLNEELQAENAYVKSNHYIGVEGVLKRGPEWQAKSQEALRAPTPAAKVGRVEGGAELLRAYLEARALFRGAYRKALAELRATGSAEFPVGTWLWPRITSKARLATA